MIASEIRALFAVASRPEIVSLAGGMPPADAQGDPGLQARICDVMALEGITDAHPDNVVVTAGSQQALDDLRRLSISIGVAADPHRVRHAALKAVS